MIFLVGHHGSGKTAGSTYLVNKFDMLHIETSGVIKEYKLQTSPDESMEKWVARIEKEFGTHYFDSLILEHINLEIEKQNNEFDEIIITGNRMLSGVNYLKDNLRYYNDRHLVLGVHASDAVLFFRYRVRNREAGDATITFAEFQEKLKKERLRGLEELLEQVDFMFSNNSSMDDFFRDISEFMTDNLNLNEKGIHNESERVAMSRETTTLYK